VFRRRFSVFSPLQSLFPSPRAAFPSGEVSVDLLAVETANERHGAALKNKTNPVITHPNAIVFAGGFETLEIGNLLKGPGRFNLLNDLSDPAEQRRVLDDG
jgi:hypothetical protein